MKPPFSGQLVLDMRQRGFLEAASEPDYLSFHLPLSKTSVGEVAVILRNGKPSDDTFGFNLYVNILSWDFSRVFNDLELWRDWAALGDEADFPSQAIDFPWSVLSFDVVSLLTRGGVVSRNQVIEGLWKRVQVHNPSPALHQLLVGVDEVLVPAMRRLSEPSMLATTIVSGVIPGWETVRKASQDYAHEYALVLYTLAGETAAALRELDLARQACGGGPGRPVSARTRRIHGNRFAKYAAWIDRFAGRAC